VRVEVNEKWLGEIGGWAALKAARQLVQTGMVEEAERKGDVFTGLIKLGRRSIKSSLTAINARDALCRCACEDSTRRGLVCAHSLAVALAVIGRGRGDGKKSPSQTATSMATTKSENPLPVVRGTFHITMDLERIINEPQRAHTVLIKLIPSDGFADTRIVGWLVENQLPLNTQALSLGGADLEKLLKILTYYSHTYSQDKTVVSQDKSLIINTSKLIDLNASLIRSETVLFKLDTLAFRSVKLGSSRWLAYQCAEQLELVQLPNVQSSPVRSIDAPTSETSKLLSELLADGAAERGMDWLVRNRESLESIFALKTAGQLEGLRIELANPTIHVCLDGSLRQIEIALSAVLSPTVQHPVTGRKDDVNNILYPIRSQGDEIVYNVRNVRKESAVLQHFIGLGFTQTPDAKWRLIGEDKVLRFFASELPRLRRMFQVTTTDRWDTVTQGIQRIQPRIKVQNTEIGTGTDWLSLEVAYSADNGFKVGRNEVLRLLRGGKSSLRGQDGRTYVLDELACAEFEETLEDAHSRFESGQVFRVAADAGELWSAFAIQPAALTPESTRLLPEDELVKMIGSMAGTLRAYQLEGVRWLERLHRLRRGGLLADEMGLGKTLQSLALLQLIGRQSKNVASTAPALVVCPTSLVYNWAAEAERFTPSLRCTVLHGSDRSSNTNCLNEPGLVITSYGLIARDLDWYRPRTFQTLIMDEASHIRNPDTDAAKALRHIRAHSRFALTGTPVENSVQDLWSIFQVLIPDHLGARDEFRERYIKQISNTSSSTECVKIVQRLRRRVGPYILRRTKSEVAKDLPAKIEKIVWCELTTIQKEYYQRILVEGREEIRQAKRRTGQSGARATMFTVLLRLRQVCNDLRLIGVTHNVNNSEEDDSPYGGKWAAITDFINEICNNGGKALIFSQFVTMLQLLKPLIQSSGLGVCYLDGQSTDRAEQVKIFQTDESKKVFLISLKAGGYGLTLTAADQVVLFDPWWNPAVESQAIDRAHRIGQSQPVTALRFATRGTVEEKMLQLQSRKLEAAEMTIEDNPIIMAGLTEDDLEMMLS